MRRLDSAFAITIALSGTAFAQNATPAPAAQFATVPADAVLSSKLIGLKVYNGADENVGEIKDLVIERDGLYAYILLIGGLLGAEDRFVAVTPDSISITFDPAKKKWRGGINATKEQLKAAPEFKFGRLHFDHL
jgi:PRC-barrel domain